MSNRSFGKRMVIATLVLLGVGLGWLVPPFGGLPLTHADTLNVCPVGCTYSSIQDAINHAGAGDTIAIAAATYTETLTINFSLTLSGAGATNTIVDGNNAGTVVTVKNSAATVTIAGVTIQHGSIYAQSGGGIYNIGSLVVSSSNVISNTVVGSTGAPGATGGDADGAGIYNAGGLTLIASTVAGNTAVGGTGGSSTCCSAGSGGNANGAAIYSTTALTLTSSSIVNNTASGGGGGSYCCGNGSGGPGNGGGLYIKGVASIIGSTIMSNTVNSNRASCCYSESQGGGLFIAGGTTAITSSTVAANTNTIGSGGGISVVGGSLAFSQSTISLNSASGAAGGGLATNSGASVSTRNTILSHNVNDSGVPDCSGSITSNDYNLIQTTAGCSISGATTHDITGVSANLGPLQNNGGPTLTMALLPGSPAIDYVPSSNCTTQTDQRGLPRPDEATDNGLCDIGAYEYQDSSAPTPTPTNTSTSTPTDTSTPTNTPTPLPPTDTPTNTPTVAPPTPTDTPTPAALLGVSPASGFVGQAITLSGANYGPSEMVNIYADSISPPSAYTATTNISGTFTLKSTVKEGTNGVHTLIGVGQTSGRQATTLFTIKAGMALKPASGAPGTAVTATGTGFGAGETITLHWRSATGPLLGTGTSNSMGATKISFNVPSGSAAGRYRVYAIGSTTKARASAVFTVT